MRCAKAFRCIHAEMDGRLSPVGRLELREHLRACRTCTAEREALRSALVPMERCWVNAPDLWPSLRQRLAQGVTCDVTCASLTEYHAGELPASQRLALAAHLTGCRDCASEATRVRVSLGLLEGMQQEPPAQLWASVSERIRATPPRPLERWVWTLRGLLPTQPALVFGSALAISIGLRLSVPDPSTYAVRTAHLDPAAERARVAAIPFLREPVLPAATPSPTRLAATVRVSPPTEPLAQPVRRPATPQGDAPEFERTTGMMLEPTLAGQLEVSFPVIASLPPSSRLLDASATLGLPSRAEAPAPAESAAGFSQVDYDASPMESKVMAEVVAAVRLLAGFDEVSTRPFGEDASTR